MTPVVDDRGVELDKGGEGMMMEIRPRSHGFHTINAVVVLEWQFSPPDYFEEAINITRDDYTMAIADGKAEAKIDAVIYDANPSLRGALQTALNDRFLGVLLLTHRTYELSNSTMTRVHPEGRRDIYLDAEAGHYTLSGGTVDFQVTDKVGNVVVDSRRDRIEKKKTLAELVSKYRAIDTLLVSLLRSYDAGVRDPNNELVHLYEIREALSTRFGGENEARLALGISCPMWSGLGRLCNSEPLRQGRHRGKSCRELRDATEGELAEARGIARGMVEAYLQYLETSCSQ
ncbi:MAG: hypothetical protein O6926_08300 [candidate division NC10 bacterium]|nr:hypothetical protein [candidate division NC10 bacterium]